MTQFAQCNDRGFDRFLTNMGVSENGGYPLFLAVSMGKITINYQNWWYFILRQTHVANPIGILRCGKLVNQSCTNHRSKHIDWMLLDILYLEYIYLFYFILFIFIYLSIYLYIYILGYNMLIIWGY
jgi:hypothetical protein